MFQRFKRDRNDIFDATVEECNATINHVLQQLQQEKAAHRSLGAILRDLPPVPLKRLRSSTETAVAAQCESLKLQQSNETAADTSAAGPVEEPQPITTLPFREIDDYLPIVDASTVLEKLSFRKSAVCDPDCVCTQAAELRCQYDVSTEQWTTECKCRRKNMECNSTAHQGVCGNCFTHKPKHCVPALCVGQAEGDVIARQTFGIDQLTR